MHRKTTREAAALIEGAYSRTLRFVAANAEPLAQAFVTREGDLVIPGTNEIDDWHRFNLQVHAQQAARIPGLKLVPLADVGSWHFGFLRHADSVYRFARVHNPRFIVGHSLGGAAAQIIGHRLKIPTITFGAPRVYKGRFPRLAGEGWVLNLCRSDDPVTGIPTLAGFRHLGTVRRLNTGRPLSARSHPIAQYASLLAAAAAEQFASVEREWPRVA
jgi:hypothetical protein